MKKSVQTAHKLVKKIRLNFILIFFPVLIILLVFYFTRKNYSAALPPSVVISPTADIKLFEKARVKHVIDGDTVILSDNSKVRYIGIDSPEMDKNGKMECFGENAKNFNRQLVENQFVSLEKDISDKDKYGRLLRFVYLDGIMVNEILVSQGFARADLVPPDAKYATLLKEAENEARQDYRGMWSECSNNRSD